MEQTKMGKMTDAQIRANEKWRKANTITTTLRLNTTTDADIIEQLDKVGSKRAYILSLIRKDIAEHKEQK